MLGSEVGQVVSFYFIYRDVLVFSFQLKKVQMKRKKPFSGSGTGWNEPMILGTRYVDSR
jgi:hypothetical protein